MPRLRLASAVIALASLAACGSTVTLGASQSSGALADNGLGLAGPTDTGAVTPTTSTDAASGPIAADVTPSEAAGADGGDVTSVPTVGSGPTAVVSTKPIQMGVAYVDPGSGNAIVTGIGAGLASNDIGQMYDARLAYVNAHGGVGGRKIQLVKYVAPTSSTLPEIGAAACSYFTQDHHVDIVAAPDAGGTLYPCLRKAGVAVTTPAPAQLSEKTLAATPLATYTGDITMERLSNIEADQFAAMGWLPSKPTQKLGVLYFEDEETTSGFKQLGVALKRHGVTIGVSQAIHQFQSVAELAGMEAAVKSAELRFKAAGVTHVMCVETNAFLCGFFGVYSQQQGYYPKYAWTSMQPLTNVISNVNVKELTGSVFLGWSPTQDLQEEAALPAKLRDCYTFFRKAGFEISTGNQRGQAAEVCEEFGFIIAAGLKAPALRGAGFLEGALKAAASYVPYNGFALRMTKARRDGVAIIRRGTFVPTCDCFRYTGGNIKI